MEKRTLGNYVREFRLRNNFSLRDLANEADISYSYIHAIESNRVTPSREIAASLANGLKGALPDEILRLSGYLPDQRPVDLADTINMDLFALRLEELMSGSNWNVETLTARTNINKDWLQGWLHPGSYQTSSCRPPGIISLYKLAALFHVTPDYLAGAVHDPDSFETSFPRPKNLRDLLSSEALVLDHIPLDEADKERIIAILYAAFDSK